MQIKKYFFTTLFLLSTILMSKAKSGAIPQIKHISLKPGEPPQDLIHLNKESIMQFEEDGKLIILNGNYTIVVGDISPNMRDASQGINDPITTKFKPKIK